MANRLIEEKSPYLLQHAHNPVDWYPWGKEAFKKALEEDRPVFLSIGYSTCHWCHVMKRESFEDEEVARLLNENFICVKVDREERPDIDSAYMEVCMAMRGSGGWPLTIIMTPQKKPFFAATYIPKESRFGMRGLKELLPGISQMWREKREYLESVALKVTSGVAPIQQRGGKVEEGILDRTRKQLGEVFDEEHGGFGKSPKFPTPHHLLFLLRHWKKKGDASSLAIVEKTLRAMGRGGIYDHLGKGFHRYSTDREWLLPHFEKMLYDQATLSMAYSEAFLATGKEEYRSMVEETLDYLLREMTSPQGGFLSALDAESEGEEGKYYLWTLEEVMGTLGEEAGRLFSRRYGIKREGNFREESSGRLSGKNTLYIARSFSQLAEEFGMAEKEVEEKVKSAEEKLLMARGKRVSPGGDDKVLTDWNGLAIAALAQASSALDKPRYAEAAEKAVQFIREQLYIGGTLYHRYRDGEAAVEGFLDDYAFFAWGLVELYGAVHRPEYLEMALELVDEMESFWSEGGGYYFSSSPEGLPLRKKDLYDGAYPSGNSVSFLLLLKLAKLTGSIELENKAWALAKNFAHEVESMPTGYTFFLSSLYFSYHSTLVAIVGEGYGGMLRALQGRYLPFTLTLVLNSTTREKLANISEFTRDLRSSGREATAYICTDYTCSTPTASIEEVVERLE